MPDPISIGAKTLAADINKNVKEDQSLEVKEGVVSDKLPNLKLEAKNEDLVKLANKWERARKFPMLQI